MSCFAITPSALQLHYFRFGNILYLTRSKQTQGKILQGHVYLQLTEPSLLKPSWLPQLTVVWNLLLQYTLDLHHL